MKVGIDYANGEDKTVYHGKYHIPFASDNGTYEILYLQFDAGKTDAIERDNITINHVAKVGDHFEVFYTLRDEAIISEIEKNTMIKCSYTANCLT